MKNLAWGVPILAAALFGAGCEDGPKDVYNPRGALPSDHPAPAPFFPEGGSARYGDDEVGGDNVGRARFCSELENEQLIQSMVVEPIIPDVSLGRVPMWTPQGTVVHADDLVGLPEDGGFCDPDLYSDALSWGPTNEIVAFIDTETRLLESMLATQQYLGTMSGHFTRTLEDGTRERVPMTIEMRRRLFIEDVELDQYTSRADQADKPRAWLNHDNINSIYRFVRETYFNAPPFPPDDDCVESKICNIFYQSEEAQEVRQYTFLYFIDSGVILVFSPDGEIVQLQIEPVRVAPFESATNLQFGEPGSDVVAPLFVSETRATCRLALGEPTTWAQFKQRCLPGEDARVVDRVTYNVFSQRNGVSVGFSGIDLAFTRRTSVDGVLRDGERPGENDLLQSLTVTRQLNAPVAEFVPRRLADQYVLRLRQRLAEAVNQAGVGGGAAPKDGEDAGDEPDPEDAAPEPDARAPAEDAGVGEPDAEPSMDQGAPPTPDHPFLNLLIAVPDSISDEPQPIEQLFYTAPSGRANWSNAVVAEVRAAYYALTPEQRAVVDPRVIEPTWLIEPFVDVVLDAFSHGRSAERVAYKSFRNTDDKRWVIGFAHFIQDGVPYRLTAQYSLNYGAITAITISFGYTEVDDILNEWNDLLRPSPGLGQPRSPYYSADLTGIANNPYALGGTGVRVLDGGFDRQLGTLQVELVARDGESRKLVPMVLAGTPIEDRSGYLRQIRGQRYEFIPADAVQVSGLETGLLIYVEGDGRIGRVAQGGFKMPMRLCPGLNIAYGDDIRQKIIEWQAQVGTDAFRECEVVYNYSENGNVLDAVASLSNRVRFGTVNGRAVQVDLWR